MLTVRELVRKRCFYEKKDGTTGVMFHKSVVLSNGTTVKWNRRSGDWKITYPPRWDSAVATTLQRGGMVVANEKGRLRADVEEFNLFRHFQERMARLVDVETFLQIVTYLK